MTSFFLSCAVLGGAVLLIQLLLGLVGLGDHHDGHDAHGGKEGLSQ